MGADRADRTGARVGGPEPQREKKNLGRSFALMTALGRLLVRGPTSVSRSSKGRSGSCWGS